MDSKDELGFWISFASMIFLIQALYLLRITAINVTYIQCYAIGYFLSRRYFNNSYSNKKDKLNLLHLNLIFTFIAILFNMKKLHYVNMGIFYVDIPLLSNLIFDYAHASLGISLFFMMYLIIDKFIVKHLNSFALKVISCFDKYSFEIYVVHQIFILNVFSLMNVTKNIYVNIILILIAIFISAYILKYLSSKLTKTLSKKQISTNVDYTNNQSA